MLVAVLVLAGVMLVIGGWLWIAANMSDARLPDRDNGKYAINRNGQAHPDYSPGRHKLLD